MCFLCSKSGLKFKCLWILLKPRKQHLASLGRSSSSVEAGVSPHLDEGAQVWVTCRATLSPGCSQELSLPSTH